MNGRIYSDAEMTRFREQLARVDADLERLTAGGEGRLDHGILNVPIHKRPGAQLTDSKLIRYRELKTRRAALLHKLGHNDREQRASARRETERQAHADADLLARYGDCDEVRWSLNGDWFRVVRWSKKSVTVLMGGDKERIPANQVAGARRTP